MKVAGLKKIFTNRIIEDQPLPEMPVHTHDGQNSPLLAPDSIDTLQLKTNAVNTDSIADQAVGSGQLIPSAILTEHLNALAVTEEKLAAAAVATTKIKDGAVNAQKLIQSEAVITLSAQIADATILTAHIGTGVIVNAHLANAIISTAKIVDAAINTAKIADLAVSSAKIGLAEVKNGNIENLAVTTAKIDDLSVLWAKIGNAQVGNSKMMNAAISSAKIQDAAITTAKLGIAVVDNANIANLAVTNAKINDLNASKVTTGQMSADRVYGGTGYFDSVNILMSGLEALNVAGNINKTGTSNFAINHPLKVGHRLIYTGIEAAEVLLIARGTARLKKGEKKITLPDHFQAVSDPRNVTAHVTPREPSNGLYIQEATKEHILVKENNGSSNASFDYFVYTVRLGYFDFDFEPEGELLIESEESSKGAFKQKYDLKRALEREGKKVLIRDKEIVIDK